MIETLDAPVTAETQYGQVQATHRGWGITLQPWNAPGPTTYSVLGVMVGDKFTPIPGTETYVAHPDLTGDAQLLGAMQQLRALHLAALAAQGAQG